MNHNPPQIVTVAERLMVEIEDAVSRFPRRHKYGLGDKLRAAGEEGLTRHHHRCSLYRKEVESSERSGIRTRHSCGFFVPVPFAAMAGRVTNTRPRKGELVHRLRSAFNLPATSRLRVKVLPRGFSELTQELFMSALPCAAPVGYSARESALIKRALKLVEDKHLAKGVCLDARSAVRDYLRLRFAGLEREELHAIYLDSGLRLIAVEVVAIGTHNTAPVYPRELLIHAARHGAVNMILAHNHPGGTEHPSAEDVRMTQQVDVVFASAGFKLLDHFVVTANSATSIIEHIASEHAQQAVEWQRQRDSRRLQRRARNA